MGRIKSLMIKKASKQLVNSDKDRFGVSFEYNKKALGKDNLPSKSTRNKIAGYIARVKRMERDAEIREARKKAKQENATDELPQYVQY